MCSSDRSHDCAIRLFYAVEIGFTLIILAALGSRFFKLELRWPLPVEYGTA